MEKHNGNDIVNIGSGIEVTIRDLAHHVKEAVGYTGQIEFDVTKPDGTPRKLLDCSRLHSMGWRHRIELDEGIRLAYKDFLRMLSDKSCSGKF
jgi:GDP-L-fucose synthase